MARYYRKKRTAKKRTYKKKYVKKVYKDGKSSLFKLRGIDQINSDSFAEITTYYSTTNPTAYINGSGTLQDWSNVSGLYEQYRICAVKLKYIPALPNSITANFAPMYIVCDWDSPTISTLNVSTISQYENMKVFNAYRPWTFYTKIPKTTSSTSNGVSYGFFDSQTPASIGVVQIYANAMSGSTTYGRIIATYYIKAKVRN